MGSVAYLNNRSQLLRNARISNDCSFPQQGRNEPVPESHFSEIAEVVGQDEDDVGGRGGQHEGEEQYERFHRHVVRVFTACFLR